MRGYLTYGLPLIVIFIFLFGIYDKFLNKILLKPVARMRIRTADPLSLRTLNRNGT